MPVLATMLVAVVSRKEKHREWSTYTPNVTIPLEHVLGAEADPEIEREMWRGWAFGRPGFWRSRIFGEDDGHRAPDPGVRFYNPRHSCADKAVVIRLRDEDYERLVVEVEDPEGAVERINRAVGASASAAGTD